MKKTSWKISLGIIFLVFLGLVFTSPSVNAQVLPNVTITSPTDALNTLYTYVHGLSPSVFVKSQYQKTVLNTINSVIKQTQSGAYYQASLKLFNLADNIDTWITAGDSDSTLMGDIDAAFIAILDAEETTVGTLYGQVSGADAGNDCWVWAGIPYARPPVGALRWKAPQDPKPWTGIRLSTLNFSRAWQPDMSSLWFPVGAPSSKTDSEDCLYLNIFRPKDADAGSNLPVLVWIHGGGNVFGQANIYNASLLASKENMIVVVIQYRLGPFGFFYFPALNPKGTAEDQSGNYVTLDTIQAVKWVKHNIRFFGGNPKNITVGGQSAGGFNTLTLLTSPLASGLFQKAFVMSAGGGALPPDKGPVYRVANVLLGNADSTTPPPGMSDAKIAAFLRKVPAIDIEEALMDPKTGSLALGTFNPSIDGTVITDTFANVISAGKNSQIPIMIGNTEYETKPFLPLYVWGGVFNFATTPPSGFVFDPNQTTFDAIWTTVNPAPYGALPAALYQLAGQYAALDWKAVMVDQLATSMVNNGQDDVYAYQFIWGGEDTPPSDGSWSDPDSDSTGLAFLYGAGHASDIPFFFGWDIDVYALPLYNSSGLGLFNSTNQGGRVALQQAMMDYLGNFVHSGDPNGTGLTPWDTWSNTGGNTYIVLDATATDANISMTTGSYTDAGVVGTVVGLSGSCTPTTDFIFGFFSFSLNLPICP